MPPNKRGRVSQDADIPEAAPPPRAIFRTEALEHYVQNQEKLVLPQLISPRSFFVLWIIASIVMVAGLILAFWPWLAPLATGVR